MKLTSFFSITAIIISLAACGGNNGGSSNDNQSNSETTTKPKKNGVSLPKINPNRPKAGRGALVNVPWLAKDMAKSEFGITFRPYFYITDNAMTVTYLCGTKKNGSWKWISPSATSPIAWDESSFTVLEEHTDKDTIEDTECSVTTLKKEFEYEVYDNGERMTITVDGQVLNLELFRDVEQGSRSEGDVTSAGVFSATSSNK